MPKPQPVRVYPVEGLFIQGVPHVEHDCVDPFCAESGAFTPDPPPPPAASTPDGPADAGPLDSTED